MKWEECRKPCEKQLRHFAPWLASTNRICGFEAKTFLKRLAIFHAEEWEEFYPIGRDVIIVIMSIAIVRHKSMHWRFQNSCKWYIESIPQHIPQIYLRRFPFLSYNAIRQVFLAHYPHNRSVRGHNLNFLLLVMRLQRLCSQHKFYDWHLCLLPN